MSGKNPNVMFELGMRLAFDKPTIIIKDDKTDYTFDTSIIEHLTYPRDLRFSKIVEFKEQLKKKITGTYNKSISDPSYSTFLKSFGQYKIAQLDETEVSPSVYILTSLEEMKNNISRLTAISLANSKQNADFENQILLAEMERFVKVKKLNGLWDLDKHLTELFQFLQQDDFISSNFKIKNLREKVEDLIPPF